MGEEDLRIGEGRDGLGAVMLILMLLRAGLEPLTKDLRLSNQVGIEYRNKIIAPFLIVTALRTKKATMSCPELCYCIIS